MGLGRFEPVSENEYIIKLKSRRPCHGASEEFLLETLALADKAVREFPQSPKLWCLRGDFIQLGPESSPHSLEDALACYQRATELDPKFIESWEELGHFHDAILDDKAAAKRFFSEAERLKGQHAA